MKKQTHIIIGICILFLLAAGFLLWRRQPPENGTENSFSLEQDTETEINTGTETSIESSIGTDIETAFSRSAPETIASVEPESAAKPDCAVYLSGAVKKPGLYHYHGFSRLSDAVRARGGFRKNAAREAVNLARPLVDGEQIHIPNKKEAASSLIKKNMEENVPGSGETAGELININTAPLSELEKLPGIGASRAEAIIAYRTEHGPYTDKKDLMKISGIKEGIFQKIEALITI